MEAGNSSQPPPTAGSFPVLDTLDPASPHTFITPVKQINDGPDVSRFLTSKAYRDIGVFVMQLNRAMVPRKSTGEDGKDKIQTFTLGSKWETDPAHSVKRLQSMLAKIMSYIDEAPPDPGPRRFGNVSFRKWYELLEQRTPELFREFLPDSVLNFKSTGGDGSGSAESEITAYFLGGFGSAQRLDYGTGHELSFLAFLGCLWKLGAFKDGTPGGDIERNIVLGLFEPYLRVVRRLILTYTLEPAGSHGVWGLDDHSFQPYIYGSAQLSRAITESEPTPLEGSLFRAPKPATIVKGEYVEEERKRYMYFSAIGFINDVKKGPFWEHSPILFDISGIKDGWGKINKGMIKMFNAEVLSKFPVVQHFPFGSLFSWEQDPNAPAPEQSVHMANQPMMPPSTMGGAGMPAPWAQPGGTGSMPPPGIQAPRGGPWGPAHPAPTYNSARMGSAPWQRSSDRPSG
ncbi:serine/threonine-protein phosphatase-like protein 2A activator 1 [Xylariomycetidae sp. FL0641]|nr:serine/threonine-protein phosphatase-like protein 2A activator 1 [Xylariomycetidae sp. FL0641]